MRECNGEFVGGVINKLFLLYIAGWVSGGDFDF